MKRLELFKTYLFALTLLLCSTISIFHLTRLSELIPEHIILIPVIFLINLIRLKYVPLMYMIALIMNNIMLFNTNSHHEHVYLRMIFDTVIFSLLIAMNVIIRLIIESYEELIKKNDNKAKKDADVTLYNYGFACPGAI